MAKTKTPDPRRSAITAQAITNSTTTTFTNLTRAFYVGTSGNLSVTFNDSTTVLFKSCANGYHPIEAIAIQGDATTATDVVAVF